jgi:two-component sensor histidine kinase
MADAIRDRDWTGHPLGPPEGWSPTLKSTLGTVLGSRFPQCLVWGEHMTTLPNDAFLPILGDKPDPLGKPFSEVWSEVWHDIGPIASRAFAGEPTYVEDFELLIDRADYPETAWFTFCYSPVRDDSGTVVGMLDTVIETTSAVRATRQSSLVARELVHRVKNSLSLAMAIAVRSMRGNFGLEEARERVETRLSALAQSHDVLLMNNWDQAPIRDVVSHALKGHIDDTGRLETRGAPLQVSGRQALSLSLALHELATNAAKYGALANADGRVRVEWEHGGPDGVFRFRWSEEGGPPVSPPGHAGFGSQILSRVLTADFEGRTTLDYDPAGLRFTLECPASALPAGQGTGA